MLRILLLPLLLFTISMACMGQTFQYSRGWTNGKRSVSRQPQLTTRELTSNSNDNSITDFLDDPWLERYLLQYPRYSRNALWARLAFLTAGAPIRGNRDITGSNSLSDSNNNNNNLNSNNNRRINDNNNNHIYEPSQHTTANSDLLLDEMSPEILNGNDYEKD